LDQIQWTKSIHARQGSEGDRPTRCSGIFGKPALISMPQDVQDTLAANAPFPSRLGRPGDRGPLFREIIEYGRLGGEVIRLDGAIRMAPE